jgi:ADP-ribosylglycohydrolase
MSIQKRIEGSLYGLAIGDALGWPVEFANVSPADPQVTDLITRYRGAEEHEALFTDDTQMTIAVAEGLIRAGTTDVDRAAEEVAEEFVAWLRSPENNRAPGGSCLRGCRALADGVSWREAGVVGGGGCGAAMRSAPYGWLHPGEPEKAAEIAAEHAQMTHRLAMAQASAAAVAAGVSVALVTEVSTGTGDSDVQDPWMPIAVAMVDAAMAYDHGTARMLLQAINAATQEVSPVTVLDKWRGWAGHEAVAASLYCLLYPTSRFSYESAVLLAVNSPGDSDSLGCIAGAIHGALFGVDAVRPDWIARIEKTEYLGQLASRFAASLDKRDQPEQEEGTDGGHPNVQ